MNAVARALTWLIAIALVLLPVVALVNGWIGASHWPLRTLRLQGDLHRVSAQNVRATVLPFAQRGYFAVDLDGAQHALEKLSWVQSAQVHKRWPDILEVRLVEHMPFARWGEDRLLSARGELFPMQGEAPTELPRFDGADDKAADVVALYNQAQEMFAPTGLSVRVLALDARGSWSMMLSNGTRVTVGSSEATLRLRRFARLLPQLQRNETRPLQGADLRYTNGFALVWGEASAQASGNSALGSETLAQTRNVDGDNVTDFAQSLADPIEHDLRRGFNATGLLQWRALYTELHMPFSRAFSVVNPPLRVSA